MDYCWFYGGDVNNRDNVNKIPYIGDTFTAIASYVYYDLDGFKTVKNYKDRLKPGKNEVNFAYANSKLHTIIIPDYTKFVGREYVIWNYDQICPFISVKFKREKYCIIWRDDNFGKENSDSKDFDEDYKNFLKERMRYINQKSRYNVYPCKNTYEALKIIKRKKYNKIILITNIGPSFQGLYFIEEARKLMKNKVIALFLGYNIKPPYWVKNYKNAIFSNNLKFYEEYLDCFGDKWKMKSLISKLETHYNIKFYFDDDFLDFPLYKEYGEYSDLTFNK